MAFKTVLLKFFTKKDQFNYKCNICGNNYKTPNGGVGNLRKHYENHLREPRDDQTQNKKQKIQSVLVPLNDPSLIDDLWSCSFGACKYNQTYKNLYKIL